MSDKRFERGMLCVGPFRLLAPDDQRPPEPGPVCWTVETLDYAVSLAGGVAPTVEEARCAARNALEAICRSALADLKSVAPGDSWFDWEDEKESETSE